MIDTKRVTAHIRKAESNLREARILLDAESPGGTVNRAYYALFDGILALLHTTDGPVPKTHTGAHTEFRKQFIRTGIFVETYSSVITELFNLRQGGDYEIDFDISLEDAQSAIEQANRFLLEVQDHIRQQGFI